MLASVVGAVIYALLWWVDYLQQPGRRQEARALRIVRIMLTIAVLGGALIAPFARIYAAHRWTELAGWEGSLFIGFIVGIIAPVLAAKVLAKALKTEIDLPGDKP